MKLIYLDESGNTGIRSDDPFQPYHLIAALVVDDIKVPKIENEIRTLGLKHIGEVSRNTDFEFHGYEIHKGKGRYFSKLKVPQRIEVVTDLLGVMQENDVQVIYTVIKKLECRANLHPHQLAFLLLSERIEDYLGHENSLGLLIADENQDIEQRLIDDLERFKVFDTGFGYRPTKVDRIIDSIHFVKSHNNYLIQLADVVAYTLSRGQKTERILNQRYIAELREARRNNGEQLDWLVWVEDNATIKQKTELHHMKLLNYKPMISKEFPA